MCTGHLQKTRGCRPLWRFKTKTTHPFDVFCLNDFF